MAGRVWGTATPYVGLLQPRVLWGELCNSAAHLCSVWGVLEHSCSARPHQNCVACATPCLGLGCVLHTPERITTAHSCSVSTSSSRLCVAASTPGVSRPGTRAAAMQSPGAHLWRAAGALPGAVPRSGLVQKSDQRPAVACCEVLAGWHLLPAAVPTKQDTPRQAADLCSCDAADMLVSGWVLGSQGDVYAKLRQCLGARGFCVLWEHCCTWQPYAADLSSAEVRKGVVQAGGAGPM